MLGLFFYKDRANPVFCGFCFGSLWIKMVLINFIFVANNIKE